jgi:dihydrofolate reductase
MMVASLDGYAADANGGVDWLDPFNDVNWGWDDFIASIRTVVMGRLTYQQTLALAPAWPYPGKRSIVLGKGFQEPLKGDSQVWDGGLSTLIPHLRALDDGDVWVVGGPSLQSALIAEGALDRLQLCVVPHLLGQGMPVFPKISAPPWQPTLTTTQTLPRGMVMLDYQFSPQ